MPKINLINHHVSKLSATWINYFFTISNWPIAGKKFPFVTFWLLCGIGVFPIFVPIFMMWAVLRIANAFEGAFGKPGGYGFEELQELRGVFDVFAGGAVEGGWDIG